VNTQGGIASGKIGIFDSGYGGLTVMRSIVDALPGYDYTQKKQTKSHIKPQTNQDEKKKKITKTLKNLTKKNTP